MRNTKSKIILVMCIAMCFMVVGYAAFSTSLSITGTSNITSEWNVVFTKIEEVSKTSGVTIVSTPTASGTSATFNVGLALPGDKIVYQITIENKGTIDAKVQNIVASATDSPAIIFNMSGIQIGEEIKKQTTKTFTVTIEYNPATTSQPDITNKTLTVNITMVQSTGASATPSNPSINQPLYLSSAIFRDNIAYADNTSSPYVTSSTGIDFSQISSDTNGKGLYFTSTNTENNLPTYYFRGDVVNNYVHFGKHSTDIYYGYYSNDYPYFKVYNSLSNCQNAQYYNVNCTKIRGTGDSILWRIIRINEDGSMRLITQDIIGSSSFNSSGTGNAYIGYMYGNPNSSTYDETHDNVNNSTIKEFVDAWYIDNLLNYSNYLADAGFCNDRSVAPSAGLWYSSDTALGYGQNTTYYGGYNRLYNNGGNSIPTFVCPDKNRDLFTTRSSSHGNKDLTYPIGLITADEIIYTGAIYKFSMNVSELFLYNGGDFYTMTPLSNFSRINVQVSSGGVITFLNNGTYGTLPLGILKEYSLDIEETGVRPVINLKSTVEITGGNGTSGNPYIVK